ncbi:MAG TPA: metallophosphoesterase [Longimicrobiaceae bacterium]|nr:metallophosphoesterase [Longimicrobiaceae bacterium]
MIRSLCAATVAALLAGGCAKPVYNLGKVIGAVSPDSVALDLFLIGDAGLPAPRGEPVLQALKRTLRWDPHRSYVVFLGDNVYPAGLPPEGHPYRKEAERILDEQVEVLRDTRTRGLFVPGNHDWEAGGNGGWDAVQRQAEYVLDRGNGLAEYLPRGGCPGPEVVDVGEEVRIVALDTQWWLHDGPKPRTASSGCAAVSDQQVIDSVRAVLRSAGRRATVVVAHHPLVSGGEHGGYFDWPTYVFPLYPWARKGGFGDQDVSSSGYRRMIRVLSTAFVPEPPLVYAAGHEHNLQVLRRDPARYLLVSGGGIYGHITQVRAITGTRYANRASGFMRLSILRDGRVRLAVILVDAEGETTENYSAWLERPRGEPAPAAASIERENDAER